ncbi:RNA ligase family protein [Subtercola sp. RTI3]|uniref:RNA ligase family protein n=1 Tax=Subtercola sp. RTI3 TaxID=3048639 RepID=UPI002B228D66|nr:RNA ligase family protein [Subtercola sp. RTI3]MEA9983666.1 RNA ligase family protein [Subtercola sp. RTI3]
MVFFSAESQLSLRYAYENSLHRHSDRNVDKDLTGYLEDNRRVKALKFRGHQSDSLLMPLSSLAYLGISLGDLKPGDTFDQINGHEICTKYLVKQPGVQRIDKNSTRTFSRIDSKFMPEHYDTDNYFRNAGAIADETEVIVTQKLHGTSIRIGNTVVRHQLGWKDRLAKRLGVRVAETGYAHVYGSRKVIKDANNPNQNHFYATDLWSEVGSRFDDLVPENFLVYGEVVGWTKDGAPIQKNYTYNLPDRQSEMYVYRVAVITNQGRVVDLGWDQVKTFCTESGLKYVPELWRGRHADFDASAWIDVVLHNTHPQAVPLSPGKKLVDEGVVVRAEGKAPYLLKAKSPIFLQHESKMLDEEAVDIEAAAAA